MPVVKTGASFLIEPEESAWMGRMDRVKKGLSPMMKTGTSLFIGPNESA